MVLTLCVMKHMRRLDRGFMTGKQTTPRGAIFYQQPDTFNISNQHVCPMTEHHSIWGFRIISAYVLPLTMPEQKGTAPLFFETNCPSIFTDTMSIFEMSVSYSLCNIYILYKCLIFFSLDSLDWIISIELSSGMHILSSGSSNLLLSPLVDF